MSYPQTLFHKEVCLSFFSYGIIMTTENKDIPSVFTGRKSKTGAAEKEYALRSLQRRENHTKGQYSEDTAAEYLKSQGYRILERNWRFHRNEIDIIAMDGSCLVLSR